MVDHDITHEYRLSTLRESFLKLYNCEMNTNLEYALADIMHICSEKGISFQELLDAAQRTYNQEHRMFRIINNPGART